MLKLGDARDRRESLLEHRQIYQQPNMGPFTRHLGSIGPVQVSKTQLTQGIGPSLGGRSWVWLIPRSLGFGIRDRAQSTKQRISCERIKICIDSNHAHQGP
jgi:hypothetical protein